MRRRATRLAAAAIAIATLTMSTPAAAQDVPPSTVDAGARQVTILQTTDIHDHANGADHVGLDVEPTTGTAVVGAYARIAAYVNSVRATAGHPVVLVDSGDWTMGTLYDLTLGDQPLALYFLKTVHYDCITFGNHEFDYSTAGLAHILGAAQGAFDFDIPIVATNMNVGGDVDLAPFVGQTRLINPTHVEELPNGLRVGYIGLMGRNAIGDIIAAAPVTFWDPTTNYTLIQKQVDALRAAGVQIVIVLSHSGTNPSGTAGEDVDLARNVRGIDVIASGHTHTPLPSAQIVKNGDWTTRIIDAGWAGTNVSRIDLTYFPATRTTSMDASSNPPMTASTLNSAGVRPDPAVTALVGLADHQLNTILAPFFAPMFPDYNPANLGTGVYHPVGTTAQLMASNDADLIPPPNGLGDLAADAIRSVENSLIAGALAGAGGNPLPGFDYTPVQVAIVPTGALRGELRPGVAISFADVYNVLPLGFSPDLSQPLPVAYPLISTYVDVADLKKICALQLLVQSGLAPADYYLNISGLQYTLSASGAYDYFKYATAAGVLRTTSIKAAVGSTEAIQALSALSTLAIDSGAALLAAYAAANPYAVAMVDLNDTAPTGAQIAANLAALGQVAAAAAADAAAGTTSLVQMITAHAVAAIDGVAGFAPGDAANTGAPVPLVASGRVRVVVDLFTLLLVNGVSTQLGLNITAYQSATGSVVLSAATLPAVLDNRLDAEPSMPGVQELKGWMALLYYIRSGLGGAIGSMYQSTSDFMQFGSFGVAVTNRNPVYPVDMIAQLLATLGGLQAAP
jgi:2',3'-cyclic-nucleotide 2'-phosphodiesterase (5'-nucleotidase family)